MTDNARPQPLSHHAILGLLASGACIQRDRHGATAIRDALLMAYEETPEEETPL